MYFMDLCVYVCVCEDLTRLSFYLTLEVQGASEFLVIVSIFESALFSNWPPWIMTWTNQVNYQKEV